MIDHASGPAQFHYFAVVKEIGGPVVVQRVVSSASAGDELVRRLTSQAPYDQPDKYVAGVLFSSDPDRVPVDLLEED